MINVKDLFNKLDTRRSAVLTRAENNAELTIPNTFPKTGDDENSTTEQPWNSIGAIAVNTLANNLLVSQVPVNEPFFKLNVDDATLQELEANDKRAEVDEQLIRVERIINSYIEEIGVRVPLLNAFKNLIVTGNALLYYPIDNKDEEKIISYSLRNYVVQRDIFGNVNLIIVKEIIDIELLPDNIKKQVQDLGEDISNGGAKTGNNNQVELFTMVKLNENKKWQHSQEVAGIEIKEMEKEYKFDENPYIPIRFTAKSGENYGRGYIEDYLADLNSLEVLTQLLVEGSALAAKTIFIVDPNAGINLRQLEKAPNGSFVKGNRNGIHALQTEKNADLSIAYSQKTDIENRLEQAFLMKSSVTRNAERVTATEIKTLASELETNLGGIYSILSQELQLPLIKLIIKKLQKVKKIPDINELTNPVIVTGLDALGRGNDSSKLNALLKQIAVFGEQGMAILDISDYIKRQGNALGIDMNGLIKSKEQLQQEAQQVQQQAQQEQLQNQAAQMAVQQAQQPQQEPTKQ